MGLVRDSVIDSGLGSNSEWARVDVKEKLRGNFGLLNRKDGEIKALFDDTLILHDQFPVAPFGLAANAFVRINLNWTSLPDWLMYTAHFKLNFTVQEVVDGSSILVKRDNILLAPKFCPNVNSKKEADPRCAARGSAWWRL